MKRKDRELTCDRVLLLTSSGLFALFIPLAWWAHKHPHPRVDVTITHHVQKKQRPFMLSFVKRVNGCLCSDFSLNVLAVPVAMLLWKMHLRLESLITLALCWTSTLVRRGIKQVVNRPRPSPLLVHVKKQSHGQSFPSGDVASSLGLWGWLCALGLLQRSAILPGKKYLLSFPLLLIVLVGPARVYLGDHWATDVLGGYLFGGGWLGLWLRLYLRLRGKGVLNGEDCVVKRADLIESK